MKMGWIALFCSGCLAGASPVADLSAENGCGMDSAWFADPTVIGGAPAEGVISTAGDDWAAAGVHGVADCGEPFAAGAAEWTPVEPGSYTIRAQHVANDDGHEVPVVLLVGMNGSCNCAAGDVAEQALTVDEIGAVSIWIGLDAEAGADRDQYWDDDEDENGFEADYRVSVE